MGGYRRKIKSVGELTPREVEVVQCAADGMTASKTAATLGIARETVKTHRRKAILACEARNITHAVAVAYRLGVIV